MTKKIITGVVVVIWIALLGMLMWRNRAPDEIEIKDTQGSEGIAVIDEREDWMGIYYEGRKIGFSNTIRRKMETDQYAFNHESNFRFPLMGEVKDIQVKGITITDSTYNPEQFKLDVTTGVHAFTISGEVKDDKLRLISTTSGHPSEQIIDLDDDFTLPVTLEPMLAEEGLEIGKKFSVEIFDPLTTGRNKLYIEVVGVDSIEVMNEKQNATKLKITMNGIDAYSWVDDEGRTLREEGLMGMVMVRQTKEMALKLPPASELLDLDMAFDASIPSNVIFEEPREITSMKVALYNADFSEFNLEGPTQKIVEKEDDRVVLQIHHKVKALRYEIPETLHPEVNRPVTDDYFSEWLAPEMLIQSDDERIINQANEILGNQKKLWSSAATISKWVHEELKKVPVPSVPSALDVLKTKEGDCNEHSMLTAALNRAAGIPTRIAVGVVYLEGSFYYHAWVEVWDGQYWVPMDPTFGNNYADATHIKLLEGGLENYVSLLKVIGRMKIEVLDYTVD